MANSPLSNKRVQINKATSMIVIFIAAASFVTVFSLVATRALLSQRAYQARVIDEKEKAKKQLEDNIKTAESLQIQYRAFVNTPENVLGGNSSGSGDKDGDNARIVLDALPSKYDFPALATSLEKILSNGGFKVGSIGGSDDELGQDNNAVVPNPQPILIPVQLSVTGSFQSMQNFVNILEHSIRPIRVKSFSLGGGESEMQASVTGETYYQPSKSLSITTKEVK
jgi:hypothetical protein